MLHRKLHSPGLLGAMIASTLISGSKTTTERILETVGKMKEEEKKTGEATGSSEKPEVNPLSENKPLVWAIPSSAKVYEGGKDPYYNPGRNLPGQPRSFGKVRPNDQCPCGSGRKYKNCHRA